MSRQARNPTAFDNRSGFLARDFFPHSGDWLVWVQAVGEQPLGVECLGQVADARITQECDDHLARTTLLCQSERASQVDAGRESDENSFLAHELVDNT